MKTNQPLVSVVMPVRNAGEFLAQSFNSMLSQTYSNIEFIVVDDASTDDSLKILKSYKKRFKNITLLENKKRLGISVSVKRAITQSRGKFVARMDADDVSLPERLDKQVKYLLANKKTVAVGGQCFLMDRDSQITGQKLFPTRFDDIYKYILRFIPVQQPTLMIAKERLPEDFEYYRDGQNTAEEVELLFKLFQYGKVENLPDFLLCYRIHGGNTSLLNLRETFLLTLLARFRGIFNYGYKPDFLGVLITIAQTTIVLCLPKSITMLIYKMLRKLTFTRTSEFTIPRIVLSTSSR